VSRLTPAVVALEWSLSLYYNSDTTASNYDTVGVQVVGAVSGAASANNAVIIAPAAGNNFSQRGYIRRDFDTRPLGVFSGSGHSAAGGTLDIISYNHRWQTTATNVTGITISSSVASAMSVGTTLRIWKLMT
jgi:hypothetical protein